MNGVIFLITSMRKKKEISIVYIIDRWTLTSQKSLYFFFSFKKNRKIHPKRHSHFSFFFLFILTLLLTMRAMTMSAVTANKKNKVERNAFATRSFANFCFLLFYYLFSSLFRVDHDFFFIIFSIFFSFNLLHLRKIPFPVAVLYACRQFFNNTIIKQFPLR